jgi:hypothetical protein
MIGRPHPVDPAATAAATVQPEATVITAVTLRKVTTRASVIAAEATIEATAIPADEAGVIRPLAIAVAMMTAKVTAAVLAIVATVVTKAIAIAVAMMTVKVTVVKAAMMRE